MLTKPVSIMPCFVFSLLTLVCFGVYAGIIPGAAGWVRVFCFYLVFMAGIFTVISGAVYVADNAVRLANMRAVLHPEARLVEAISRMNHEQVLLVAALTNTETEPSEATEPNDFIRLSNGETVETRALERIADNVDGDELRAERSYQVDRQPVRAAHDALTDAGLITPARGNTPPRIADREAFEQVVALAKKRGGRNVQAVRSG